MNTNPVAQPTKRSGQHKRFVTAIPLTTLTLVLPIVLSGLVDIPGLISLGPVSLQALLTVYYCMSSWFLWLLQAMLTRTVLAIVWPLILFAIWGFASMAWYAPTITSFQNLLVPFAFLGLIVLASSKSYYSHKFQRFAWKMLARATWVAVGLYGVGLVLGGLGSDFPIGDRSFALFALLGTAWYVAAWRYNSRRGLWQGIAIVALIGASLSRTALVAALILFPLSQASLRHVAAWVRTSLVVALVVGLSYLAVSQVELVRERFFTGDIGFTVGGTGVNVSGRDELWRTVLASWSESPWIGKGAGSSSEALESALGPEEGQVHNDYLRILHDYGVFGLVLWLLAIVKLVWAMWKAWLRADRRSTAEAHPHLAALLSLVALVAAMITDNVVVYIFFMAPLGVLVGASLGRMKSTRQA
jgi:O-antigen ligase